MNNIAQTVAEANVQSFTLPALRDWREFAGLLNGYDVAKELGFDVIEWGSQQETIYTRSGDWELNVLELRLMVFFEYRADYFTGYTYHERDDIVDSLLQALSIQTGLPYHREGS